MIASHYKPELAETIYQDVFFTIDGEQFPEDADVSVNNRIHEQDEALEQAQDFANSFNQTVEIGVYGTWGYFGKEYVETITVQPQVKAG